MSLIEYKDVELRRKEFVVLKDVTFNIDSGQPVYLVVRSVVAKALCLGLCMPKYLCPDKAMPKCSSMI